MQYSVSMYHIIVPAIALFFISAGICAFILKFFGIVDTPNNRSSHTSPTPTAGGAAIVISFFIGIYFVYPGMGHAFLTKKVFFAWMISSLFIAIISFYDDLQSKSFTFRLIAETIAIIIAMQSGIVIKYLNCPAIAGRGVDLGLIGYLISFFWILGLINAYNFMDGLNGMAAGNAVVALIFLAWISFSHNSNFTYIVSCILISGTLGFMIFNFPIGRIFMGDIGSTFLGFSFATLAIISCLYDRSHISLFVIPLLLFHFIYDTFFTFCRRLISGENVFQAHRTHLYQLFNQLGFSHVQVSCFYFALAFVQGCGALVMVNISGPKQLFVFVPYLVFQIIYSMIIIYFAKKQKLI